MLIAALRARLPGYATIIPDVIQRRLLETPGTIITTTDSITVRLERRGARTVLLVRDARPPKRDKLAEQPMAGAQGSVHALSAFIEVGYARGPGKIIDAAL